MQSKLSDNNASRGSCELMMQCPQYWEAINELAGANRSTKKDDERSAERRD